MTKPELAKYAVERGEVRVPMDQQRAQRMVDVVSNGQVDVLKRVEHVEDAADVDVESCRAQRLAKAKQIVEQGRRRRSTHATAPHAR